MVFLPPVVHSILCAESAVLLGLQTGIFEYCRHAGKLGACLIVYLYWSPHLHVLCGLTLFLPPAASCCPPCDCCNNRR
jgi:hypothetical protein